MIWLLLSVAFGGWILASMYRRRWQRSQAEFIRARRSATEWMDSYLAAESSYERCHEAMGKVQTHRDELFAEVMTYREREKQLALQAGED